MRESFRTAAACLVTSVITAFIILLLVIPTADKKPEITRVNSTSPFNLTMPGINKKETVELSSRINKRAAETAPDYEGFTDNQKDSDFIVNEEARKVNKPDKIIKTTEQITSNNKSEKVNLYQNKYYGINLNKRHSVSVGGAYINSEPYASVSYRNREITYSVYGNDKHYGVGINYNIKSW
jgi:hypothetical protein